MWMTGAAASEYELLVGTYSRAGGGGLYPLARSTKGEWRLGEPDTKLHNVSFGVHSPRFGLHYFLDEAAGTIAACRLDAGEWTVLRRVESAGEQPCHLALHPSGAWLACANYGDGVVSAFRLDDNGLPTLEAAYPNEGGGPDAERQEGPHAHWVGFRGGWLYQVDLGADMVRAFPVGERVGAPQVAWRAPPGSGPRHLAFAPSGNIACLVSELASTVTVLRVGEGELVDLQTRSTLPDGFGGDSLSGHIGFDGAGNRLFVTNRGHDSIAIFPFDGERLLPPIAHIGSGAASPRLFLLLEEPGEILVANEEGDAVTVLAARDRCWQRSATIPVPAPALVMPLCEKAITNHEIST